MSLIEYSGCKWKFESIVAVSVTEYFYIYGKSRFGDEFGYYHVSVDHEAKDAVWPTTQLTAGNVTVAEDYGSRPLNVLFYWEVLLHTFWQQWMTEKIFLKTYRQIFAFAVMFRR